MLRHFAQGPRRFGLYPMHVHQRLVWEFFAVLKGRVAPILQEGSMPLCTRPMLWIFPPKIPHGWTGQKRSAQVVVIHYGYVPAILDHLACERGFLEIPLDGNQCEKVRNIASGLKPHYEHPNILSPVIYQQALCDLTLLACEKRSMEFLPTMRNQELHKIEISMSWYLQHLSERPSVQDAARAAHISASHLRRLFLRHRKESPQAAFIRARLEFAIQRMTESYDRLDVIAKECGFGNISDLNRRFKAVYGSAPGKWRRKWTSTYDEKEQKALTKLIRSFNNGESSFLKFP